MNKQEAIQKLEDTEKELAKLRAIIEAPESNQWKPEVGSCFFRIEGWGEVDGVKNAEGSLVAKRSIKNGNCFKTPKEAKSSLKYRIMNSEYDYWIPGISHHKIDFQPKGLEYFSNNTWHPAGSQAVGWTNLMYRWKRSEQ